MKVVEASLLALDFETTGSVPGYPVEPWQIGWIRIERGQVDWSSAYSSLMRVGDRPFNPYAPGRHHALREELKKAPDAESLWPSIERHCIGRPLVAHHAPVERSILRQMAPLHKPGPWVDTLVLARQAYPDAPTHKLEEMIPWLGLEEELIEGLSMSELAPHDALYDAAACAVLLCHLLKQPGWDKLNL